MVDAHAVALRAQVERAVALEDAEGDVVFEQALGEGEAAYAGAADEDGFGGDHVGL